ncbi:ferrochelatase [Putridiphycobacter roseus]|uniref:Ferrochelatase n=1 Tax=Putridiphycobacter roseus TaxID=2219161 RepID=A0A2W1NIE4_9FLAO|nr:ferrochelatase [Putridiphycobacter roseus]PZE18793.1 ferrochelatase [Putridiphycobacter roseus]
MKAVLMVNLGSPDSTKTKDVKKYLAEFLMDERVIDIPYVSRFLLVKGIILNTRPKKSAAAYQKIWWKEGSPLVVISHQLRDKVSTYTKTPVYLAMRYGNPSIHSVLKKMNTDGVTEILLMPMYPHYAMASTETVEVLVDELQKKHFPHFKIEKFKPFYNNPAYIQLLADKVKSTLNSELQDTKIVFSYHGLPERQIYKTDPTKSHCKIDGSCCTTPSIAHKTCYRHQCFETTRLVAENLQLKTENYTISFQSRLGRTPWLLPATDQLIEELGNEKIEKLAVISPAFVSDCLETLEEINMEARQEFTAAGGGKFTYIPCLNVQPAWAELIGKWINNWN